VAVRMIRWSPTARLSALTLAPVPSGPSRLDVQTRAEPVRAPSSGSLPVPARATGWPCSKLAPSPGEVMAAVGGWFRRPAGRGRVLAAAGEQAGEHAGERAGWRRAPAQRGARLAGAAARDLAMAHEKALADVVEINAGRWVAQAGPRWRPAMPSLEQAGTGSASDDLARRDIHRYPEPGFEETRTQARIRAELESAGLRPRPFARTGLVADLGRGGGATIALRADIDCLRMTEENSGLPYRSERPGRPHVRPRRASPCWSAPQVPARAEDRSPLRFLLQPAEEGPGRAGDDPRRSTRSTRCTASWPDAPLARPHDQRPVRPTSPTSHRGAEGRPRCTPGG
jgi:hypothetical protein